MTRYAVAVGSNRGDRAALIARAADLLAAQGDVAVEARSALVETAPVGGPAGQGAFLNGAWIVATALGPHQLLHRLQAVEHALGRTRSVADGPRTIDLDLLLAEDGGACASPVLTLPHPRLHLRRFVLQPLAEVAPGWRHPQGTVAHLLATLAPDRRPPTPAL
jgi:2-amino-4-hydroxy-6-hydroxymethyldihydropteridine diphosphokinase